MRPSSGEPGWCARCSKKKWIANPQLTASTHGARSNGRKTGFLDGFAPLLLAERSEFKNAPQPLEIVVLIADHDRARATQELVEREARALSRVGLVYNLAKNTAVADDEGKSMAPQHDDEKVRNAQGPRSMRARFPAGQERCERAAPSPPECPARAGKLANRKHSPSEVCASSAKTTSATIRLHRSAAPR